MNRNKQVLLLLLLLIITLSSAEVFYNILKQEDLCISGCKEKEIDPDKKCDITCCQRGCRFFNLVNLRHELEPNNLNNSLDACDGSCMEAYSGQEDLTSCRIGCALMAIQHVNCLSPYSFTIHIEDGIHPNILVMSPSIADGDVLTDSAFEKELLPGWWDSDVFKLPEIYLKTVPIDSGTADYSVTAEYVGESGKSTSVLGSDWLQCASRHTGIPRWMLAVAIATAALSALWLCLSPEKSTEPVEKITIVKPDTPSKVAIYLPDEAPLHKKPPPKYSEVVQTNDPNLQV